MAYTDPHPDYPAPYAPNPKLSGDLRTQVIDAIEASNQPAAVVMRDIIGIGVQLHLTERRRQYFAATGMSNGEAFSALIDFAISAVEPQKLRNLPAGIGIVSKPVLQEPPKVSPEIVPVSCTEPALAVHETNTIPAAPAVPANRWHIRLQGPWQLAGAAACLALVITGGVVVIESLVNRILPPPTTALIRVDHR